MSNTRPDHDDGSPCFLTNCHPPVEEGRLMPWRLMEWRGPMIEGAICGCGLPMSKNPHPDAGKPNEAGVAVGYAFECIPCLVKVRNRVGAAWRDAQAEVADGYTWMEALVRDAPDPGAGALAWLYRNKPKVGQERADES